MPTWSDAVSIASTLGALVALIYARHTAQIARRSLDLARKSAQAAYEDLTASRAPAATLLLTEIEYRRSDAETLNSAEERRHHPSPDSNGLEVVLRGRLINNLQHEILLTCRDHPNAHREIRYPLQNESVFFIEGEEVELGNAILPAGAEASFMWVDRRSRREWINLHNLHDGRNMFGDPELELPALPWYVFVGALIHRRSLSWVRQNRVARSGFSLVSEPRTTTRVATVWFAEVIRSAVTTAGRDEAGRIVFEDRVEKMTGPLDDRTVYYRARFDPALTQVDPPKVVHLAGRQA